MAEFDANPDFPADGFTFTEPGPVSAYDNLHPAPIKRFCCSVSSVSKFITMFLYVIFSVPSADAFLSALCVINSFKILQFPAQYTLRLFRVKSLFD
jgi:hypothetical protein